MSTKKNYTQEEIEKTLKNTVLIPNNEIKNLNQGDEVSYYKTNGEFTKTVYFSNVYKKKPRKKTVAKTVAKTDAKTDKNAKTNETENETQPESEELYCRFSNFKSFSRTYPIKLENIKELYKHIDINSIRIYHLNDKLQASQAEIEELKANQIDIEELKDSTETIEEFKVSTKKKIEKLTVSINNLIRLFKNLVKANNLKVDR